MPEEKSPKKKDSADIALMQEVRERYRNGVDANKFNVDAAKEDQEFHSGDEQWDAELKKERESQGRPCLTINKLPAFIAQVVGDQRQNRPQIKVHPVDGGADQQTAEVIEGLIRNIESISQADIAYDHAFECAVGSAWGWMRVVTEYADEDVFDQDIKIQRVPNQFSVVWDQTATQLDLSDAGWMFITETLKKEEFETRFPKASLTDFEDLTEDIPYWVTTEDGVRIAEYFRKVPKRKVICLLQDGSVIDKSEHLELFMTPIVKEREVDSYDIEWRLVSGTEVLEGPKVWPGRYFPLIPVWGKELWVGGKRHLISLIRHAKDAQRLYNYSRTTFAETTAMQPRVPFMVTPEQIDGHQRQWDSFHQNNYNYLLYNPDPMAPGRPQREAPPVPSQAELSAIQICDVELKATTGLFDPSLGDRVGQQSGRAIISLQRKGDLGTYAFSDNLGRALNHLGKVLIDLIPKIYDTERIVRILGLDGKESTVVINQQLPGMNAVLNNLTVGKYDVAVSFGPSFATQRLEAANAMIQFATQGLPKEMVVGIADLIADNLDWPGKELFIRRIKKMQPPGLHEDEEGGDPNKPPNPMQMQQMQQMQMQMQQAQQALEKMSLDIQEQKMDITKKAMGIKEQQQLFAKNMLDMEQTRQEMEKTKLEMAQMLQAIQGGRIDHDQKRVNLIQSALKPRGDVEREAQQRRG